MPVDMYYILAEDKYNHMLQKMSQQDNTPPSPNDKSSHGPSQTHQTREDINIPSQDQKDVDGHDHANEDFDELSSPERSEASTRVKATTDVDDTTPMSYDRVLQVMSQKYHDKAIQMLHLLRSHLKWTGRGEIVKKDGTTIHGSHIGLIVRNLIEPYKRRSVVGSHYVRDITHDIQLPKHVLHSGKSSVSRTKKIGKPGKNVGKNAPSGVKWVSFK